MRRIVLSAVLVLASCPAFAGDLPVAVDPTLAPVAVAPVAEPVPVARSWSGAHVGVYVSRVWNDVRQQGDGDGLPPIILERVPMRAAVGFPLVKELDVAGGRSGNIDADGFQIGAGFGYDHQYGSVVVGGVADLAIDTSSKSKYHDGYDWKANPIWTGSLRGRVGYALGEDARWLPYLTGGLAVSRLEARYTDRTGAHSDAKNRFGWTIGGGLETALTDNVSIKGEYLFSDYGSKQKVGAGVDKVDYAGHAARLGLNYRFDIGN